MSRLVEVFREVRRVLADDGTLWLNLGDSYAQSAVRHRNKESETSGLTTSRGEWSRTVAQTGRHLDHGLKPKDLVGIPWRVAFALQADGWWLRSDIIWSKPNPMPESVTDRPTKAHEYLFLMAKSGRYFYDADAIREDFADERMGNPGGGGQYARATGKSPGPMTEGVWTKGAENGGRNRRSVWTISTKPFAGAHFAVMPWDLVEPCVLAGSRPGELVLDPFAGSGTVGMVARRHGRSFVGIELNPTYAAMARQRIAGDMPLFNAQAPEVA